MIRCLVKGNAAQASEALLERGIIASRITPNGQRFSERETFWDVPEKYEDKLSRWFCEPTECEEGKGFPPGTLLYYSRGKE